MSEGLEDDKTSVDVLATAERLAALIGRDPGGIDRDEMRRGEKLLVVYQDPNFSDGFKGLRVTKGELLREIITDLADRARKLSSGYYCLVFRNNLIEKVFLPYSEAPQGTLVFKVALKDVAGFQRWRKGEGSELSPDDLHAGIYLLTVELSRLK